jgi:hypothetical protein
MRRRILIALLAVGTVAGYGSAFAHLCRAREWHRAAFERHVADVCLDAARRASDRPAPPRD